jgi:hypothetical protein
MARQEDVRTSSSNQVHYGRTASVAAAIGARAGRPRPDRPAVIEWRKSLCESDIGPIRLAGGARIRHSAYVADLVTSWRRR